MKIGKLQRKIELPDLGTFIYDGYTNRIHVCSESDFPTSFHDSYCGLIEEEEQDRLYSRNNCLESMTLLITRQCNLRCNYCIYSGNFEHMHPHSDETMSMDTVIRAIDFFEEHSRTSSHVTITFYGGEALLQFTLIKSAIEYARKKLVGRKAEFGICSNGLLLNKDVIEYLRNHADVQVQITVNGKMHDVFRKTPNGDGSLKKIIDNINKAKEYSDQVWTNQICFIANIMSYKEIPSLREFYNEKIGKLPDLITRIDINGCNDELKSILNTDRREEMSIADQLRQEYIIYGDEFLDVMYASDLKFIHDRPILTEKDGYAIFPGCSLMTKRIFVKPDGTLNICEQVSDDQCFGNVYKGYDNKAIDMVYNNMSNFVKKNCMGCWAQHLCNLCFRETIQTEGLFLTRRCEEWCINTKANIERNLETYIRMNCPNTN